MNTILRPSKCRRERRQRACQPLSLEVGAGPALERIVLGQRTADLLADARLASCFADPLRNRLASHLAETDDAGMREAYLEGRELRRDLLVPSPLHAAPALGALVATLGWAGAEA